MRIFAVWKSKYGNGFKVWDCTEEHNKAWQEIEEMEKAFKCRMTTDERERYVLKRIGATTIFPAENEEEARELAEIWA